MDYVTEIRLGNALRNLDGALQRNDKIAADLIVMEINRMLAESRPASAPSSGALGGLPKWMRDLIANQGLRVPALERALSAHKVVVSPSFGSSGYGLKLEVKF